MAAFLRRFISFSRFERYAGSARRLLARADREHHAGAQARVHATGMRPAAQTDTTSEVDQSFSGMWLHDETRKALAVPAVRERLATFGVEPMPMTVDEFGKFYRDDVMATIKLARDINLVPTN